MRRIFFLFTCILAAPASLLGETFEIDDRLFNEISFVRNDAPTYFGTYLVRNVPFGPISQLKNLLSSFTNFQLLGRDEAHITVITPPEYEKIKNKMTIDDIHVMVSETIQHTSFEPVCIGEGSAEIDGNTEHTYFVVVRSTELTAMRRAIAEEFYARGGKENEFDAEAFYPHITVGFTKRDLHVQDGVVKDQTSCFADVHTVNDL